MFTYLKNSNNISAHLFAANFTNSSNTIAFFPFGESDILLIIINGILSR